MLRNRKVLIICGVLLVLLIGIVVMLAATNTKINKPLPSSIAPVRSNLPTKELNGKTKVILSEIGHSERGGWVTLKELEGKMWLHINIDADEIPEDDHDFPATLRSGSCFDLGSVVHILTPVYNGGAETTLGMSVEQFRKSLPLSLVVEQSPTDNTIVACGDITVVY